MNDATVDLKASKPSMRRTLLTLLGAVGAFGVLTASYATAELPNAARQPASMQSTASIR